MSNQVVAKFGVAWKLGGVLLLGLVLSLNAYWRASAHAGAVSQRLPGSVFRAGARLLPGRLSAAACPAFPATIAAGDVAGLIEAINCANSNGAGTDDVINLTNSTYTLTAVDNNSGGPNGLPAIVSGNGTLTINGNGATLARSSTGGTPAFRIFNIGSGSIVTLSGMTVSNGRAVDGGGINSFGTLTIINSTISGNTAAGGGNNRGGGIWSAGPLTLTNCTISGNLAEGTENNQFGGGIYQNGTGIFTNCTISGNRVVGNGSSDFNFGGGIYYQGGTINLTNCTITANSVTGGATCRGGGINANLNNVTLRNTIVAGNTVAGGTSLGPDVLTINSAGFNLIGNTANATINGDTTGNILNVNPQLGPLTNNGGPTQTHALQPGSPALNVGNDCVLTTNGCGTNDPPQALTTDQRGTGFPRQIGGMVDIGAFETDAVQSGATLTVNTTEDPGDGVCTVAHCTLREAINLANVLPGANTITFNIANATFGAPPHVIRPVSHLPAISEAVTINGLSEPDIPGGTCPIGSPTNDDLAIQIDDPGNLLYALLVNSSGGGSSIRGLSFTRFGDGGAIQLQASASSTCNYIGVAADGTTPGGNEIGVLTTSASNITIGGPSGDGNVIANSARQGIYVSGGTTNSLVRGNVIRNSGLDGIVTQGVNLTGVRFTENAIYANGQEGIDLNNNGLTPNDTSDADVGHNNQQNFPVITSAATNGTMTAVNFTLDSNPGNYTIEFFSNPACDGTNGEGQVYLGSTMVTLPGGPFSITTLPATTVGHVITATALKESGTGGAVGDTSEFSACASVASNSPPVLSGLAFSPSPVSAGQQTALTGTATDANAGGTLTLTINWGDGSPNTVQTVTNGTPFSFNHTYLTPNVYNATVTVSDGIAQDVETLSLTVNCVTNPVVTNTNDSGAGSLREAIALACPGGTITFANGVSLITLTSGELVINKNLTISGPGADTLTVSGNQASRVFTIAANTTVNISSLAVSGGRTADGPGGLFSAGSGGDGGGIHNSGTLKLDGVTVSGNSTGKGGDVVAGGAGSGGHGGGIYNGGTLTVINSTLSGNSTGNGGDAVAGGAGSGGHGGGIYNGGTLTVINSTLSGNSTGRGGGVNSGSGGSGGSGGGIRNSNGTANSAKLGNAIVALNNTAGTGPDLSGPFASQGHNLIGKSDDSTGFTNGTNGDQVGTSAAPINPLLAPLANNGGPTQTHALLPGSPALNAGNNCVLTANGCGDNNPALTTDQRGTGFPRQLGPQVDIGAYEFNDTTPPDTTITANPASLSNSNSATFQFNGSDDVTAPGSLTFQCQLDGGGFSPCASPKTYTGLSDGSHTFQVRAVDAAGNNDSTPASYTWVIDTTPPPAPVVITPTNGSSTNNTQPSVSGTAEASSTVAVFIDGTVAGTTNADASGNWMFTPPTPLSDGSHTVRARATDAVGNTSNNSNTNTFIVDTVAPDTTITANPTNPSASANASFSFTGNDGSGSGIVGFECQLDGGGFSSCTSPRTYTGLSDGSHTFQVRAIDAAGNKDSTPASYTWIIDTTGPDTTITANPTNPSASANASFSFTGNDGSGTGVASFQCQLDGGGFSTCTSPQTYTGLSQGSHTFQVRAVDAAGNVDSTPANYTWIIDTVAPDTTITVTPANPSNSANASFSFTGSDPGGTGVASFQCQLDGGGYGPCANPQTYTSLSNGSHTFQVRAVDGAGNTDSTPASFTWLIDTLPPNVGFSLAAPNPTNVSPIPVTVTFSENVTGFTAADIATGNGTVNNFAGSGSLYTFDLMPAGQGLVTADIALGVAVDVAGNGNTAAAQFSRTYDSVAPDTTITATPTNPSNSTSASFSFTGNDSGTGVASFECKLDGGAFTSCTSPRSLSGLSEGAHNFQVRALDATGNVDGTPASFAWTVDATPPDTTITGNPPNPSGSTNASFSFSGSDPSGSGVAGFQCQLDGGGFSPCASPQTYTGLSLGSHTFQVRAVDAAGNSDTTPASYAWSINAPPTVTPTNLSRAVGSVNLTATIATANDIETPKEQLVVQLSTDGINFFDNVTAGKVTVALVDQNANVAQFNPTAAGAIIATLTTPCDATVGPLDLFLRATDSSGQSDTKPWTLTLTPNPPPVLSYTAQTVAAGTTPMLTPAAGPSDNGAVASIQLQSVAPNNGGLTLSVNPTTGQIQVLSATLLGNYLVTVAATDNCGTTNNATASITVACPPLTLTPVTLANAVQGTAYNQTVSAAPAGTTYSYAVTVNTLPPGLTLNNTTGVITGTPTAGGNYAFGITATGWGGCTKTQSYNLLVTGTCATITVNPTTLPAATIGTAYNQTITATGGSAPYTFAVTQGALPLGLTLDASSGVVSGTATQGGSFSFRITARGQGGCTGSRNYVLTVNCGALMFTPATLPSGTRSVAYSQQLSVGANSNATFSLLLGSLPPGLTLSSAGLLSGLTSQVGTYTFTVKALAGTCQGTKTYTLVIGSSTAALALSGDYDGDGQSDLTLWSAKDGLWRILKSSTQQAVNQSWGTTGDVTLLGDYDGDGKSDLAVFRPRDATFYVKRSSDGDYLVKQWGLATDVPVPGDYDGDGKTDIAVWRGATGTWYIVRSSDGQYEVVVWGASYAPYHDVPVAGDYDGDGKSDVAVFRRGNGTWLVKCSRDGQYFVKQWGLGTDVPVAADYDGDSKTDLAVWRASTWYIWQSTTDDARVTPWGLSGDQALASDYDGDGKADVAVWRAPEQTWYIHESAAQRTQMRVQGKTEDVPVGVTVR